ncbi:ABC transporter ATP-binding protein [Patescibacteria group bacterium]|nr:ABC transporter ATP-binding protein [Patescibacteria group bacterium]
MQKNFWKNLWGLLESSQTKIRLIVFLIIIIESLALAAPYFLKLTIDLITDFNQKNINLILIFTFLVFASEQINSLIRAFNDKIALAILADSENYISLKAQQKMVNLSLSYHEKENTGSKISKIQRGIYGVMDLLANFIWDIFPTIIKILATAIVLFIADFRFGLIFIFFVPIFLYISYKYNLIVSPIRKKRYDSYEKSANMMTQSILNINTVKSFANENYEISKFKKFIDKITKNALKEFSLKIKYGLGKNFIVDIGKGLILLFGVYLISKDAISVGTFVFAYTVSNTALLSLYRISRLYDNVMESSEGVNRLSILMQEKTDITNISRSKKVKKFKGTIEFKNVEFAYDQSDKRALHNTNVTIEAGKFTALVGPSGGGKTTLARMIYRHYDPQKGEILLDGINLKHYNLHLMRKRMAIVPQEVELFSTSIRENIAYANQKASLPAIKRAAKISNSLEFINTLDKKLDTQVGERGVKLSGGQRQRIGIARAILTNPDILIFDEATSNLDSKSEKLIQNSLSKISKNRTTIVIAHRLSTIKKADKIVVLENGKIVETGTHANLTKKKGSLYSELHKLQKMGEVD